MNTQSKPKDKRVTFSNHRIEHNGVVWTIDAKADPTTGVLKVYRVMGDISNQALLNEALQLFADSLGLRFTRTSSRHE